MTAPDRPGDRDWQQAAEMVRAIWWAGAVKAPTGRATDDLAAALAAARAEEAARWQAKIKAVERLTTAFEEEGVDPALPARLRAVLDGCRVTADRRDQLAECHSCGRDDGTHDEAAHVRVDFLPRVRIRAAVAALDPANSNAHITERLRAVLDGER